MFLIIAQLSNDLDVHQGRSLSFDIPQEDTLIYRYKHEDTLATFTVGTFTLNASWLSVDSSGGTLFIVVVWRTRLDSLGLETRETLARGRVYIDSGGLRVTSAPFGRHEDTLLSRFRGSPIRIVWDRVYGGLLDIREFASLDSLMVLKVDDGNLVSSVVLSGSLNTLEVKDITVSEDEEVALVITGDIVRVYGRPKEAFKFILWMFLEVTALHLENR